MTNYIFITGGVISGIGKGVTAASLGALLKESGLKVFIQKIDPYLNVDPGTMNPSVHGEVFVTKDGGETDLDLGHYERFIDIELSRLSSFSAGMVYQSILQNERRGDYGGSDVQMIPHGTNEIKRRIYEVTKQEKPDIQIVEIGGTVGEIESRIFLEAIRQIRLEKGVDRTLFVHTTYVPFIRTSKELKTKPTQHSILTFMGLGITPDFIVLRSEKDIPLSIKEKIEKTCSIPVKNVIAISDVDNIYRVPSVLKEQNFDKIVCEKFKLDYKETIVSKFDDIMNNITNSKEKVKIALVGKYVNLEDAYISVKESLQHASFNNLHKVEISWIDSEFITNENVADKLKDVHGILVPGGFGTRGIEGKICAINYARVNDIPFLGICLGMQLAVIEFARNVCGIKDATSYEFDKNSSNHIIHYLKGQNDDIDLGGTLRLGNYNCSIQNDTVAYNAYGTNNIVERHRHRYEFNNEYKEVLEKKGMTFSGINPDNNLVEIIELKNKKCFIAGQFHPEFKSRINNPHPLFNYFIKKSIENKN